nr:hypothetical protein [Mycoplasmopsis caviae]
MPSFKEYGKCVVENSKEFAQAFLDKGVSIVSGGTDNHLFTINVYKSYGISGKDAEMLLGKFNITVNKNTVPFDTLSPMVASGIRLGSAAMTSRKFSKWNQLAQIIDTILRSHKTILENKTLTYNLKNKLKCLQKNFQLLQFIDNIMS